MDTISARGLIVVASVQAAVSAAALLTSPTAAVVSLAIGVLAVGRYASMAFFAATMVPGPAARLHALAASAWFFGFLALVAAVAAVAFRARAALPWAVAAAFAGPVAMSVLALGSGLGALAARRRAAVVGRTAAISANAAGGER